MARHWKEQQPNSQLDPKWTYFVAVCSFTFRFDTIERLQETLEFYRCRIHPTSRLPDPEWVEQEARIDPIKHRQRIDKFIHAEHDVIQRWWERLPLYLQEDSKRPRVVTALERAVADFA